MRELSKLRNSSSSLVKKFEIPFSASELIFELGSFV